MKLNGVHWLEEQVAEFGNLKDEEKSEIIDFCMLWSFFEGRYLNENGNVNSIREFATKFEKNGGFTKLKLDECVKYFVDRYVADGEFTHSHESLYLEKSGNPPEVNQMLKEVSSTTSEKLIGCLVIIYRFRNNLFHGVKWQYNFLGQLDNFTHANKLLMKLMQLGQPNN